MNYAWTGAVLACVLAACSSPAQPAAKSAAPPKASWSYEGATGPSHWGELDPAWVLARTGKQQSPIDIATASAVPAAQPALVVNYQDATLELLNNGHTIEDDYHDGGTLTVGGHAYKLAQFHFHSPSEHTLDGKHAPIEAHFVHKDADGKLAVIGVLIQEGAAHPELARIWKHLPAVPRRAEPVEGVRVNAAKLLPANLASYRYSGSLTTPPCSEQVAWYVLHAPIHASAEQIAEFRKLMSGNNRPTQPLNGRTISACK